MQKGNFMNITRDITFNQLTEAPLDRAIYNIWGECVFNECEEAKKVRISFDEAQQQFAIRYKYNNEEILDEQGHYYFTEDALMKHTIHGNNIWSDVSLKWLLDDKCKCEIEKVPADIVLKYHYRTIQPGEIERRLENNEHTI